ncbi:phosphatase PAP2 family protein [Actinoplanes sp. KI2]|uniref:phosphatase PAP2 family protein n=1 Tax=Actinoplanes sp. KI2 TaxID=2983315 RepID=UPI0021D5E8D0|nr:phosphatase PAP2 family protein [Actinoplanes sp. KI2]MCU7727296.1 phosphatase PAP2 family protein [Actinoplanes sp. KI2]
MSEVMYYAKRILPPLVALQLGMIGLGLLITKVLAGVWPFTVEDGVNRYFAAHRTDSRNAVTEFFSLVGSTPVIIGVTFVAALVLLRTLHSWREPIFLCAAVSAQAIVFFFTTLVIDRQRPRVHHLDASPPTSSFPSGHTSAAFALYAGLALILAGLVRRTWAKWLCWLLVLVPVCVATSRLYRGMHHPSDVTASFLNGALCITIMALAVLRPAAHGSTAHGSAARGSTAHGSTAHGSTAHGSTALSPAARTGSSSPRPGRSAPR